MPDDPWYKDGLPFACTRCGQCCTGEPGFVWVDDDELAALAKFRGERLDVFTGVYTRLVRSGRTLREKANGDCVFWEAGRGCTVYPVRPVQCRTWPFWESNLTTPEKWAEVEALCPGSGVGTLIPVEEITARVRARKM